MTGTVPHTPPPGPLFWILLLYLPALGALAVGCVTQSLSCAAHAYMLVCFGTACFQGFFFSWWQSRVEGNLGLPVWVHLTVGVTEMVVVALRIIALTKCSDGCQLLQQKETDEAHWIALAMATVVSFGIMGGASWMWFLGQSGKQICFVPAAAVLATTWFTRPKNSLLVDFASAVAFCIGHGSAGFLWHLYNKDGKDEGGKHDSKKIS